MNYFQSQMGLIITPIFLDGVQARPIIPSLPPLIGRAPKPQQNRETLIMRMISEKAVAFVLALVMSGTAFNTLFV